MLPQGQHGAGAEVVPTLNSHIVPALRGATPATMPTHCACPAMALLYSMPTTVRHAIHVKAVLETCYLQMILPRSHIHRISIYTIPHLSTAEFLL